MPQPESHARNVALSFLPESYLIRKRKVWPIRHKIRRQIYPTHDKFAQHIAEIASRRHWEPAQPQSIETYSKQKDLGSLMIVGRSLADFSAHDVNDATARIRYRKKDATILHVNDVKGLQSTRQQLALAAAYISRHQPLRRTKLIAGLTHPHMGKFATRLGFRAFEVDFVAPTELPRIYSIHLAYCAVNGQAPDRAATFKPAVIGMRTEEFIDRFSLPGGIV